MIAENADFTGNTFEVQISSGPGYPAIPVKVQEFRPLNPDILIFSHLDKGSGNDGFKLSLSYAPPVGILEDEMSQLNIKCLKYINSVTNQDQDSLEWTFHDTSKISWNVLKVINSYLNSSNKPGDVSRSIAKVLIDMLNFQM